MTAALAAASWYAASGVASAIETGLTALAALVVGFIAGQARGAAAGPAIFGSFFVGMVVLIALDTGTFVVWPFGIFLGALTALVQRTGGLNRSTG